MSLLIASGLNNSFLNASQVVNLSFYRFLNPLLKVAEGGPRVPYFKTLANLDASKIRSHRSTGHFSFEVGAWKT